MDADGFNLNTSHVLIYQIPLLDIALIFLFKYISCSYLSSDCRWAIHRLGLFKYISCSYLSWKRQAKIGQKY